MGWLIARTLAVVSVVIAGAVIGAVVGSRFGSALPWALIGFAIAAGAVAMRETWRGHALMEWMRGPQTTGAPRPGGFWGELAYRTERALRSREAAIQQEQKRLEQFFSAIEASPNGVMLLDATDQIEWCNSAAAEHFGLDPTRDRMQRVTNLIRMPAFVAHLQAERFDEAISFPGPLGRTLLSVMVRPYGEGAKLVLSQDITERERTESVRRDFVANVSHEIRTPLTVVAGFVETLSRLTLTEVERQRVLTLMQQQTDRMQILVGDLLTLAKLEGSPRPAPDHWLSVASVIRQAKADAVVLSAGRHVIEARGGDDAEIAATEAELISAATNLLHNAVRYTPEGGRIEICWRWREDGGAELAVIDTGIGIGREHIPRLTERFYRVDGSRSRDTGGTGLGLSIVKHVVQRHGGEIDVQSEPGKGSTFRLIFPGLRVRRRRDPSGNELR